jgi:hypothetical protein
MLGSNWNDILDSYLGENPNSQIGVHHGLLYMAATNDYLVADLHLPRWITTHFPPGSNTKT